MDAFWSCLLVMDVSEPNTSTSGQGQSTPGETAGTTEVVTVDQK